MRYLIYLTLLASTSLTAGSIHKWTDAEGNVFYGDTPPTSAKTEGVRVQPAPSNPGKALPRLSSPDSPVAADSDTPATDSNGNIPADQAKIACDNAKEDLDVIGRSSRVKIKSTDGTTRYLTSEEIDQRKVQAEDDIQRFCQ
jgi:hypothetical protein